MTVERDQVQDGEKPSPFIVIGKRLDRTEMDEIKRRLIDVYQGGRSPPAAVLLNDVGRLIEHADACEDEMRKLQRTARGWQEAADAKTVPSLRWWIGLYLIAAAAVVMFGWQYFGR